MPTTEVVFKFGSGKDKRQKRVVLKPYQAQGVVGLLDNKSPTTPDGYLKFNHVWLDGGGAMTVEDGVVTIDVLEQTGHWGPIKQKEVSHPLNDHMVNKIRWLAEKGDIHESQ